MNQSSEIDQLATALAAAQGAEDRWREGDIIAQLATVFKRDELYHIPGTLLGRFWQKVRFGLSDCWYWVATTDGLGYGRFAAKPLGETRAHRASYRLFRGDIPPGMMVMHSCDVRRCVNPDHLSLGTQFDNMRDMVAKGRNWFPDISGEKNGNAILNRQAVERMRMLYATGLWSYKRLAEEFGVSPMAANRAVRGVSWK